MGTWVSSTPSPSEGASSGQGQQGDVVLWQLVAWLLGIIGALIAYVAGPKEDPRVRHWIRMSVAFFIVAVVALVVSIVIGFIPVIGFLVTILIDLGLLAIWVLGIIKIVQGELWKPPIVSRIAEAINI